MWQICLFAAAFFAVNDVSSMNSVDNTSVKCYLTVFAAGVTRCLALIKVVTPMLLVACTFGLVVRDEQESTGRNSQPWFAQFLVMTSFMSLYFFYCVTNEGSWLNMGVSLSRYVTALILPFAMSLCLRLGQFFSSASLGS